MEATDKEIDIVSREVAQLKQTFEEEDSQPSLPPQKKQKVYHSPDTNRPSIYPVVGRAEENPYTGIHRPIVPRVLENQQPGEF
jgi:hypothetical protein